MPKKCFVIMALLAGIALCGTVVRGDEKAFEGKGAPPPPPQAEDCLEGRGAPPPGGARMPQHIRRYFERLRQENPAEFKRIMELRVTNQEEFLKEIKKAIPTCDHEMRRHRFDVDRKCFQLAGQLREATDEAERQRLSAELDAAIEESLTLVLSQAEAQLAEMQKYIDQLKNERERLHQERRRFFLEAKPPQGPPPPKGKKPPL